MPQEVTTGFLSRGGKQADDFLQSGKMSGWGKNRRKFTQEAINSANEREQLIRLGRYQWKWRGGATSGSILRVESIGLAGVREDGGGGEQARKALSGSLGG